MFFLLYLVCNISNIYYTKNSMSKVSVVMPVYNTEKYVWEAIQSILSQTFTDYELVIIDDCSSDNSYKICQEYAKHDDRIKLYKNEKNIWVVRTRNELFKKVSKDSSYIAILDADDISKPNRLKKQYDYLEQNTDISIIWSHIQIIDESSNTIWYRKYPTSYEQVKNTIIKKSPLAQPAVMIRKSDLLNIGDYNTDFERCQDYELWFRFFDAGYRITNIDDYLLSYRVFDWQGKSKHLKLTLDNTIKIQKKYIYNKKYYSISNILHHHLLKSLSILPNNIILKIFKILEYKNNKW